MQFYHKCVHDISEFFELPHDKCFDGSFGAPSMETIDSLEMIGQVLKDTITELSVPQTEVKLISKALTTIVNEHLFAKARELGLNEAVGCLEFAINFASIVEEVMKRITKLPSCFILTQNLITKFHKISLSSRICHLSLSQVMYLYLHKM